MIAVALLAVIGGEPISRFNVEWLEPTIGPGSNKNGHPTYKDAMPLGNGRTTALAWANTTNGGVNIFLGSQEAMSGQTELFKLGMLELALSPNPWTSPPRHYNQTLDIATGTLHIELGTADCIFDFRHSNLNPTNNVTSKSPPHP
eukprot:gene19577-6017_t